MVFKLQHEVASLNKTPAALFCSEDAYGCHLEVYPRPDGEIYICGIGGSDYLDNERISQTAPEDVSAACVLVCVFVFCVCVCVCVGGCHIRIRV